MNYPWILSLLEAVFTKKTAGIIIALLTVAGGAYKLAPIPAQHHWHGLETLSLTSDPTLEGAEHMWEEEVARRFPDALVVFGHGGDIIGEWAIETPDGPKKLKDVAMSLTALYPDREIVFVSCNPGHYVINIPHVHTANANVWIVPDKYYIGSPFLPTRSQLFPEAVGNIFEFN